MAKPLLQFPHNYNYVSREVMYHWFNRHLKLGLKEPIVKQDYRPLSVAEMSVWDRQHPPPPGGDAFERILLQRLTEDSSRQIEALTPTDESSWQEYRRIVGGAVDVMIGRGLPESTALTMVNAHSQYLGPWRMTKCLLHYPAQEEELPVIRLEPTANTWNHRIVIWIDRCGKQSLFTKSGALRTGVQTLLKHGVGVIGADLFGQGEFTADGSPLAKARLNRSKDIPGVPADAAWQKYAGYTFCYNPPVFSQRVRDLLSLVAFARSTALAAKHVDVIGLTGAGVLVAAARAIAGHAIGRAAIDTAGFRFANLTAIDDPDFLPGSAKYGDLPGMLALSAPYPLWLAGEDNRIAPSVISAAYRAIGHPERLAVSHEEGREQESLAIEWLLKDLP